MATRADILRDIARAEDDARNAAEALTDARMALAADDARRRRIVAAGDAYARTIHGANSRAGGPTNEAREVFARLHAAHLSADGILLSYEAVSVLWAEIVRRNNESHDYRAALAGIDIDGRDR